MLAERYVNEHLESILLPKDAYRPFPTVDERAAWDALPATVREEHITLGERYLGFEWPLLTATQYMDFARTGNRRNFEEPQGARRAALSALVLAECIEDKGRFLDDIIDGIWLICEESTWCLPAHGHLDQSGQPLPEITDPVIDLFVGETASLLAMTHYLLQARLDQVSHRIAGRIRREVHVRVIEPFLQRDDFWWLGFGARRRVNNWNPWCNSNCLAAALLLEEDSSRRTAAVAKAMRSLDHFLAAYHSDGGCDEGTSYWGRAGGSLFDALELLYGATDGAIDVYDVPLVQDIGRYLYRAHISGNYYVNFADGGAQVAIDGALVYRYGRRIADPNLVALGASAYQKQTPTAGRSMLRAIPSLFMDAEIRQTKADAPRLQDVWLDGIQMMAARTAHGSDRGLYLAAKGGHNAESHNHNDVGNFIVYVDGRPLIIDVGVETYTKKTFGPQRYEIWTMQSGYHNLPTVNGNQQSPGETFSATNVSYTANQAFAELALDIHLAYPAEAKIDKWRRTLRLTRSGRGRVDVADAFALKVPATSLQLSLMLTAEPKLLAGGGMTVAGFPDIAISWEIPSATAEVERIHLEDSRLRSVWGDSVYRVLLVTHSPVTAGEWRLAIETT